MGEAELRLLHDIYADWSRGDFSNADWTDPGIVLVDVDGPARGERHGRKEVSKGWAEVLSSWEDFSATAEEVLDLEDGRVLVLTRNRGRGKASGLDLDTVPTRGANLFTFRDGRVTRIEAYWDRENAFRELGIAPE
jgi:ketosteroid isomerase-like protein